MLPSSNGKHKLNLEVALQDASFPTKQIWVRKSYSPIPLCPLPTVNVTDSPL